MFSADAEEEQFFENLPAAVYVADNMNNETTG